MWGGRSGLMVGGGATDTVVEAWRNGTFTPLTREQQIEELRD